MSTFPHTSINTIIFQSFDEGISSSKYINLEIYICYPSRPIMIICHSFHEGNHP